jgi:methylisocitrate lyase
VYDPLGARIAEDVGFKCIGLGGYAMGAHLAISEPLCSLDEIARITRSVSLVCKIPVMTDAGAGYGEPLHVMHTVRVLEAAGAGALHIEDQVYPKRVHYHKAVEHVISIEDMVMKIRAAVNARRDPDFVICARTDSMRTHGYEEGIRRARLYMAAGADMIQLFPNDERETRAAPQDLPGVPLIYVNSTGNKFGRGVFPAQQLGDWGWKFVSDAISTVNVTAHAVRDFMMTLKTTGSSGLKHEEAVNWRSEVERTIGLNELYRIEEETVEQIGAPGESGDVVQSRKP